jgi:hypothetical protein
MVKLEDEPNPALKLEWGANRFAGPASCRLRFRASAPNLIQLDRAAVRRLEPTENV